MTELVKTPVFADDNLINLCHVNELYQNVATEVSRRMRETHQMDIPITSGIWGGTYLIAHPEWLGQKTYMAALLHCQSSAKYPIGQTSKSGEIGFNLLRCVHRGIFTAVGVNFENVGWPSSL